MTTTLKPRTWIKPSKKNHQSSDIKLFCFPYAGGSSLIFQTWSDDLPMTVEICPLELPGRGYRLLETPFNNLIPLVEAIGEAIKIYLDKPFAFFGHSMGALISFELVRLLRRKYGLTPVHLFVSGQNAPQIPNLAPPIHALDEEAFFDKLRRLNGTPKIVLENPEMMKFILPSLRADFAVSETYVYVDESPVDCNITAFGGFQDTETNQDSMMAWREQTKGSFSLKMLPGDHFFIHSAQSLLLENLSQKLSAHF